MSNTITILPQTAGATLCLSLSGTVSAADFKNNFEMPLRDIIKEHGFYNLYLSYAPDFQGWDEDAAELSFKCIAACSPLARKAAYVNAPDSRHLLMKIVQPLTQLEVRYFEEDEEKQALDWIKA